MGLIENELSIVTVKDLFELSLAIPEYQRPYSWNIASTNTLFMDTYGAYQQRISEYRLGSVILHKKDNNYYIVDGQQRITTLSILLYVLGDEEKGLLNEQYSSLSAHAIMSNFEVLTKRVAELQETERIRYKSYLKESCTIVKIVTDEEQEAFQFFDSQNSRGKELDPHDLLKSYHLREMNNEEENVKTKIINSWENKNQRKLEELFKNYLFPLTQWYKRKNGLGYSSEKISTFKGIKINNVYNYAVYQKASNLFVEQMNNNGSVEILATKTLNQFQLTQPLIAGKRFFTYTLHYADLLEKVQKKINDYHHDDEIPRRGPGDYYIKQLYESILLFFADRFGMDSINNSVMKQLYTWSYSLRMTMTLVYQETVNKYASGKHERINEGLDLFARLSEMHDPEELNLIIFEKMDDTKASNNISKYPKVWKSLQEANRW
ncbi:DUF262 domain-containing protein [Bacillus sp. 31A1R]|uniref:DUF262 domain-containing protein n=1 Tax=Robertmurraya mangrovi TaxID=3098077 RepID=A0ABU5J1I4_9BACI|nr:DUF262 domain-containing protein [Bacillus sp. 31A1R]MDZ5473284.1 DUF262 domain-containing protein [Bacillus sp. 31A1R]